MVNLKIFDSPGARYFIYGWGFLISVYLLIAGIWLDSITPPKCPNSSLRTGTRAMIVLGVVLTVIFASFWGCNSYCNVVDPTVINGPMMGLLVIGFIFAVVFTSMALSAVKSSYMPPPPNNCATKNNSGDCQTNPNCSWDNLNQQCSFTNSTPCITSSYATTVLGILIAFEVFTILAMSFIGIVKWKLRGAPQREAKQKADEAIIQKEAVKVKKEDKDRKDEEKKAKDEEAQAKAEKELEAEQKREEEKAKAAAEVEAKSPAARLKKQRELQTRARKNIQAKKLERAEEQLLALMENQQELITQGRTRQASAMDGTIKAKENEINKLQGVQQSYRGMWANQPVMEYDSD